MEARTSPGFKESSNTGYQKQALLHFKHVLQQRISISMCQMSEWTSNSLPCPGILHIRAYCITCIFEESGCNCKAVFRRVILSLYAGREPNLPRQEGNQGFKSSPFSFSLLWIQCLLSSSFLVLSVACSHIGCSSLLASLFEFSFVFVGWKNCN